ncbi:MAG: hypothetical protein FWH17_00435 [Oscillospiraceae bacterium]|nr:hypothetical protein [Oscillospiraceae bacterium]
MRSYKIIRSTRELTILSMFAALMFLSTALIKLIPNAHLLGLLLGVCTLKYRGRALIPLYVHILLDGALHGFSVAWLPYLYIWLPLWLSFMVVGKIEITKTLQVLLCIVLCGLHGLLFGTMYAPAQALMFGLNFEATIAWIIAGLPFDIIHAAHNAAAAALVIPLLSLLEKLDYYGSSGAG